MLIDMEYDGRLGPGWVGIVFNAVFTCDGEWGWFRGGIIETHVICLSIRQCILSKNNEDSLLSVKQNRGQTTMGSLVLVVNKKTKTPMALV